MKEDPVNNYLRDLDPQVGRDWLHPSMLRAVWCSDPEGQLDSGPQIIGKDTGWIQFLSLCSSEGGGKECLRPASEAFSFLLQGTWIWHPIFQSYSFLVGVLERQAPCLVLAHLMEHSRLALCMWSFLRSNLLLWAEHEMPAEWDSGWQLGWNMENRHGWCLRQVSPDRTGDVQPQS